MRPSIGHTTYIRSIAIKLYTVQVAPNPTKVNLYIAEKQAGGAEIDCTTVRMNLMKGEQHTAEHRARNPFASLPVLELDSGQCIVESLPIIDYLEECFPEPVMIGTEPARRARVRELERIADLRVLVPIGRYIHATNSPTGLPPSEDIANQAKKDLPAGLEYLDKCLADNAFVAGDEVTIADCTLAAAMQFARFRDFEIDAKYTNLHRWDQMYRKRQPAKSELVM
jgi:glutathione S-transferase